MRHTSSASPSSDPGSLPSAEGPSGCGGDTAAGKGATFLAACSRSWLGSLPVRALGPRGNGVCGRGDPVQPGGNPGPRKTLLLSAARRTLEGWLWTSHGTSPAK